MTDEFAHVALHDDRQAIVEDAMRTARQVAGADSALVAVRSDNGDRYQMTAVDGVTDPGLSALTIRPSLGLGGRVATEGRPCALDDYASEPTITADYLPAVKREGLRGTACVPVAGPDGTAALLYVANHERGTPGDRTIEELLRLSDFATVGLFHAASRARERELATLRERQRIATALHDSVAQSLFAIGVATHQSRQATDLATLHDQIEKIEDTAARAREELREALARLNAAPDGLAFEARLEAELHLFERRTGQHVWVTRHGEPRTFDATLENLLIDSCHEGLTNATKHGTGSVILAHVSYQADSVLLCVQSEIHSKERAALARSDLAITAGSGLGLLRERVRQLGGELSLTVDDDGTGALRVKLSA
jgi:signal transduction histidine kinase